MKKIFYGILVLILNSCHSIGRGKGIDFIIENKSDSPIENIKFTTSENLAELSFERIKPNEKFSDFLTMKKNKFDGSYILEFTRIDGKREIRSYGYYTNGGASDNWAIFQIQNDTTVVKFTDTKY